MSDDASNRTNAVSSSDDTSVSEQHIPKRDFVRRRMLIRGAISAAPVIMTLRSGPALASTGNQAVVEMTPQYDKNATNISGGTGAWKFKPEDRQPWLGPNGDRVTCVSVDGNNAPTGITGYFDTTQTEFSKANAECGGIIIAASSGGSFTH